MDERRELVRFVHISLAITAPILFIGRFLLRHASEGLQVTFALFGILLCFAMVFALDERNKRRRRGQ